MYGKSIIKLKNYQLTLMLYDVIVSGSDYRQLIFWFYFIKHTSQVTVINHSYNFYYKYILLSPKPTTARFISQMTKTYKGVHIKQSPVNKLRRNVKQAF